MNNLSMWYREPGGLVAVSFRMDHIFGNVRIWNHEAKLVGQNPINNISRVIGLLRDILKCRSFVG